MAAMINRRTFSCRSAAVVGGAVLAPSRRASADRPVAPDGRMRFGLVTYRWGEEMSLQTLIDVCEISGIAGVELRTGHKHGIEPTLSPSERIEVKKRFNDSSVTLVGYGSNAQFHEADSDKVKANIELTKKYVRLMHDCGGSGVKVKPNGFPRNVSREKTIEQIGEALNEIAEYGHGYGQQIRVEAHGRGTQEIEIMKSILEVADHENARLCWNCNAVDVAGKGLEHNFRSVQKYLGATVHVHELGIGDYPYAELMNLLARADYQGWVLLEAGGNPGNTVEALRNQVSLFTEMTR